MANTFSTTGGTTHSTAVTGLTNGSTYNYYVRCQDAAGNANADDYAITFSVAVPVDSTPPAAIANLAANNPTLSSLTLTWTAPGDDGNTGTASSYDIRYSIAAITDVNWASASQVSGAPAPASAGTSQSMDVSNLASGTTYYFAIKTKDDANNVSAISNAVSLATKSVDTTAPTVSITSPTNSATVSASIAVQAQAQDNEAVLGVQLKVDNVALGQEDTSSPYSATWDTTAAGNGTHTLTAVARDGSGNISTSQATTVTVNNQAPPPPPPPGLAVSLTVDPASGKSPFWPKFTATVTGASASSVQYYFYCNRSDSGTNTTYPYRAQYTSRTGTSYSGTVCLYFNQTSQTKVYTAKVIVKQGTNVAESRFTVKASPYTGSWYVLSKSEAVLVENQPVKSSSSPNIYLIKNSKRVLITSWQAFTGSGFRAQDIATASDAELNSAPSANLIKGSDDDKVYLVKDNAKLWIPTIEAFQRGGFKWEDVVIVPGPIKDNVREAKLVMTADPNAYYILDKGFVRHILNPDIFNSYGLRWSDAVSLTNDEIYIFNVAKLIKGQNDDKVYLLENNQKRWIGNAVKFNALNYNWNDVVEINTTEFNAYPTADDIK